VVREQKEEQNQKSERVHVAREDQMLQVYVPGQRIKQSQDQAVDGQQQEHHDRQILEHIRVKRIGDSFTFRAWFSRWRSTSWPSTRERGPRLISTLLFSVGVEVVSDFVDDVGHAVRRAPSLAGIGWYGIPPFGPVSRAFRAVEFALSL
jgi:hypothetical protein